MMLILFFLTSLSTVKQHFDLQNISIFFVLLESVLQA